MILFLTLLLPATAYSVSEQSTRIATEFFHLYHDCFNCAIGVQMVDGRFGATTFDVDADASELCDVFTSVAPDINYVIVTKPTGAYKYAACD